MQIPTGKIEKAASSDESRPVLTHVNLTTDADGSRWLEATDSYKLVRLPAVDAEADADGMIPAAVFAEARKVRVGGSITSGDTVTYSTKTGTGSARKGEGSFPKAAQLFPAELSTFRVRLNARLLLDVAEALGAGREPLVTLEFTAGSDGPEGKPSNMRPIVVTAPASDGRALLMPVRID